MFGNLAHLIYRRRWPVLLAWIVLLAAAIPFASRVNSVLGPGNFVQKGSDSDRAATLLDRQFHQNEQRVALVVLQAPALTVHDAGFRVAVGQVVSRIKADRPLQVTYLDNPLVTGDRQLVSRDGHAVAVLVSSRLPEQQIEAQIDHLRAIARQPGFVSHVAGVPAANHDYAITTKNDLNTSESITVPILILILLVVFGTLGSGLLPLVLAGASIVLSLAMVFAFAHVLDTSVYVTNVVTVLGLGIGIDYSLFIVYRFREELAVAGSSVEDALVRTMSTTGRAVFFSGLTVAVGLFSLILTGVSFMQSMGLGGVLVPVTALLAAMTLLPALLSLLGHRINRLRVIPTRFLETAEAGIWHRWALTVMRRPVILGGVTLLILLGLALPVTRLGLAFGGLKNAPHSLDSIQGYVYMQQHFPSTPDPIQVVVDRPQGATLLTASALQGLQRLETSLRRVPGVVEVAGPPDYLPLHGRPSAAQMRSVTGRFLSADGRTAQIAVISRYDTGTKGDDQVTRAVRALVKSAQTPSGAIAGETAYVGGSQAAYNDWNDALYAHFPLIIAIILVLTYGFLFYAFRSVFLPLKAVLLNLLSVLTAYGMLELVFQQGIGSSVLGFSPEGGVAGWVPVFLFAFLFGLSMDYEVFLLSRVREGWLATGNNEQAVAFGLEKTGRLISSAATIMVVAFAGFVIGSQLQLKEFGFGLMASIAIDASLIRLVLVPAIMRLLGPINWWVPAPLRAWAAGGVAFGEGDAGKPEPEMVTA